MNRLCVLAAALALTACGSRSTTVDPDPVEETTVTQPLDGLPVVVEVWPEFESGDPGQVIDHRTHTAGMTTADTVGLPFSLVLRIDGAPRTVAAIALSAPNAETAPKDFMILSYLGDVPIRRLTYGHFVEDSLRVGTGTHPQDAEIVVYPFDEPVDAHFVWINVLSNHGADVTELFELTLMTPAQLLALEEEEREDVAVVRLLPVEQPRVGAFEVTDFLPPEALEGEGDPVESFQNSVQGSPEPGPTQDLDAPDTTDESPADPPQ